jgi:hypothetical protein
LLGKEALGDLTVASSSSAATLYASGARTSSSSRAQGEHQFVCAVENCSMTDEIGSHLGAVRNNGRDGSAGVRGQIDKPPVARFTEILLDLRGAYGIEASLGRDVVDEDHGRLRSGNCRNGAVHKVLFVSTPSIAHIDEVRDDRTNEHPDGGPSELEDEVSNSNSKHLGKLHRCDLWPWQDGTANPGPATGAVCIPTRDVILGR